MKFLTYLGPADRFDVRAFMRTTFDLGDKADKFLFNTYDNAAVPPDERGTIIEMTDDQAQALLLYPGHTFVEVPEETAKPFIATQETSRRIREERQRIYAQHEETPSRVAPPQHPALSARDTFRDAQTPRVAELVVPEPAQIRQEAKDASDKGAKK